MLIRIRKTYPFRKRKLLFRSILSIVIIAAFFPMLSRLGIVYFYRVTLKPKTRTMVQLINDLKDPEFGFGTGNTVLLYPYSYSDKLGKLLIPYEFSYIKKMGKKTGFELTTMECLYLYAQTSPLPVSWDKIKLRNIEFIESRFTDQDEDKFGGLRNYWAARWERYGHRDFVYISKPLFSRNCKWAIMTISRNCGSLCEYTYCLFLHLDADGIWRVRIKKLTSMS
ncbi:MAG: hypothetical protein GXO69_02995 [Acidobacteria bacterium]|nr:hypothetical protein [Acidobacteriota bacterium]